MGRPINNQHKIDAIQKAIAAYDSVLEFNLMELAKAVEKDPINRRQYVASTYTRLVELAKLRDDLIRLSK